MDVLTRMKLIHAGVQLLKDALAAEAEKRPGRKVEDWTQAEAGAMCAAASRFAQRHGLRVPLLADVVRVERQARGHSDYASKWALYVTELTLPSVPGQA